MKRPNWKLFFILNDIKLTLSILVLNWINYIFPIYI